MTALKMLVGLGFITHLASESAIERRITVLDVLDAAGFKRRKNRSHMTHHRAACASMLGQLRRHGFPIVKEGSSIVIKPVKRVPNASRRLIVPLSLVQLKPLDVFIYFRCYLHWKLTRVTTKWSPEDALSFFGLSSTRNKSFNFQRLVRSVERLSRLHLLRFSTVKGEPHLTVPDWLVFVQGERLTANFEIRAEITRADVRHFLERSRSQKNALAARSGISVSDLSRLLRKPALSRALQLKLANGIKSLLTDSQEFDGLRYLCSQVITEGPSHSGKKNARRVADRAYTATWLARLQEKSAPVDAKKYLKSKARRT